MKRMSLGVVGMVLLGMAYPRGLEAAEGRRTLLMRTVPEYPELARQMRLRGDIILAILIQPDGHVTDIKVVRGHPLLVRAATEAVGRWRYSNGPEATAATVEVTFQGPPQ